MWTYTARLISMFLASVVVAVVTMAVLAKGAMYLVG